MKGGREHKKCVTARLAHTYTLKMRLGKRKLNHALDSGPKQCAIEVMREIILCIVATEEARKDDTLMVS